MTFPEFLAAAHPEIDAGRASTALALVADGYAPLYVARRRADATSGLSEAELATVLDAKERWDALRERQRFVVEEIARQDRLTPELEHTITTTFDRERLDDLYLPFKRRRPTAAATARDAGLAPLADWLWNCGHGLDTPLPGQTLELWAFTFRNEEHAIADTEQAIAGAEDILVEQIAESGGLRARVREAAERDVWLEVTRGERAKDRGRFAGCFDLRRPAAWFRTPEGARRYLAVRRGVNEGELRGRLGGGPEDSEFFPRLRTMMETDACPVAETPGADVLRRAALRAFDEHVWPAVDAAIQKTFRTAADDVAIAEIVSDVRRLLMAPPFGRVPTIGIDPSPRGGCKVAVVDAQGKHLEHTTVHLDAPEKRARAGDALAELAKRHGVEGVAIGDGVASKEMVRFVRGVLRERGVLAPVLVVTEIGLGPWAASEAAREEHGNLDPAVRAAIGVACRLQDPLAELAKTDPRALAGGPYVHDLSVPRLEKALGQLVATCVADVGVDVNVAPDVLIARLPGVTPGLAHAIVEHRGAHGPFGTRAELKAVPLMDARAYEQMEPFVRIGGDGDAPDPRGRLETPVFSPEVRSLEELRPGIACIGTVTNVTDFGAFVDIGLTQDGLVHVSRLADEFVKDPHAVVKVGDKVEVRVVEVNREKQQIGLTMRSERPAAPPPQQRASEPRDRQEPRRDRPGGRPRPGREQSREKPAFNNPFAALASDLKRGTPTDRSK